MNIDIGEVITKLEKDFKRVESENTRLREALKRIAFGNFQWRNKMVEIAIAALAGPEKPIRANFPPFDHRNLGKRGGIE